jgi:subtilisin-like proprotein convertase family protein
VEGTPKGQKISWHLQQENKQKHKMQELETVTFPAIRKEMLNAERGTAHNRLYTLRA